MACSRSASSTIFTLTAREFVRFMPSADRGPAYDRLFRQYQTLVADQHIRRAMHGLREGRSEETGCFPAALMVQAPS